MMVDGLIWILSRLQLGGWLPSTLLSADRVRSFRDRDWMRSVNHVAPVWFHAASLGELEMLMPIIEDFEAREIPFCVSCFSVSAISGLKKLEGRALFSGLSPAESDWEAAFRRYSTRLWIVAKYDLWPGAVAAARKLGIRVVVVNAEARSSLSWIARLFSKSHLPQMSLFTSTMEAMPSLQKVFPSAHVQPGCDPRYERVARRLERLPEQRVLEWRRRIETLPTPRGILGSAWMPDLEAVGEALRGEEGSLVVVPHHLAPDHLKAMRQRLEELIPGRYLLVDQMGLLVELYPVAHWAFVGGGFGKGIHSTIEPAVCGIPVACGPARTGAFAEVQELTDQGVLTICRSPEEIRQWFRSLGKQAHASASFVSQKRKQYQGLLESCLALR